jgi:hypothetical protein
MRVILIDSVKQEVLEAECPGQLDAIYAILSDAQTRKVDDINVVQCPLMHHMYVDGEGLIHDPKYWFAVDWYPSPLAGKAVIFATKGDADAPCRYSLDKVKKHIHFFNSETEAEKYAVE